MSGKATNEAGKAFGRLLVLERRGTDNKGYALWSCSCSCGKMCVVSGVHLRAKTHPVSSCGCLRNEKAADRMKELGKSHGNIEAGFNRVLATYKRIARENNRVFTITTEQAKKLFSSDCFWCGKEPSNFSNNPYYAKGAVIGRRTFWYSGIDRLDNSVGYTEENCVPCCAICNRMKRDLGREEFLQKIEAILRKQGRLNV